MMRQPDSHERVVARVPLGVDLGPDPPKAVVVEAWLRKIGGGVHVSELAYKTGLPEPEIIDALCELEEQGKAAPWAWTLGPESTP